MKQIKAILFDLGNVIVRVDADKLEKDFSRHGKFREGEVIDYFLDSDSMNRYMEGKLTSSQFYSKTRRAFKMDIKFHDFYRIWNSIFCPYPEMEDIIKTLRKDYPDIKLVLISNTNEAHYKFIKDEYAILELLDDHLVSHEFGAQKPHSSIFKEALRIAGTLPKDTLYTDDRQDLIDAARVMGIKAHQFTGHKEFKDQLLKYGIKV